MARVSYADLWGLRDGKYRYLLENDVSTTDWQELEPVAPYLLFAPQDLDLFSEYERGCSVADIAPVRSSGVKTHRDHLVTDLDEGSLRGRIAILRDRTLSDDEVAERLGIRDTATWKLSAARQVLVMDEDWHAAFSRCLYRPFDIRSIYYHEVVVDRSRRRVMRHILQQNVGLCLMRKPIPPRFTQCLVSSAPIDINFYAFQTYIFPLYLYTAPEDTQGTLFTGEGVTREPNLAPDFIAGVADKLLLDFVPDGKGDLENTFGPEDIFHYMYAVFHSPTYRERYAEFLKIDFPRLPLTSDLDLFRALAGKGEELVALHLMESPRLNDLITAFPVSDANEVGKVRYAEASEERPGRVYVNKTQYFEGVEPDVWAFHIGGYQVLHKWLKDRKGRKLSFDDLLHYQKIVVALTETMRLMEEIDEVIPGWPIE